MLVILFVVAVIVGVTYSLSFISYLPQLSIQRVMVAGAKEMRPELVRAYVETKLFGGRRTLLSETNVFLYPRREIERALPEYFPRIRNAKISRESLFATALMISLEEWQPFARWCSGEPSSTVEESCYVMNETGFIFAPLTDEHVTAPYVFRGELSSTTPSSPSTTTFVGRMYLPGHFAGVLAFVERLGQAGFLPREVTAGSSQDFSVKLESGFSIRASFGADIGALVKNLQLVLASESFRGKETQIEYIDLRFGNRVYYKLKGADGQSAFGGE